MKKLLLTGFEPFLEFPFNPSEVIAKELDGKIIGEYQVVGKVLPVEFSRSASVLLDVFYQENPDVVISLGLAGGRDRITPERVAINCNDGPKDNTGMIMVDQPIEETGNTAYFSGLPIRKMVDKLVANNYPAEISNSAGTYLCNNVMYKMLHEIEKNALNVKAGFIHIPASHELAVKKHNLPSWSMNSLIKAITLCIEVISDKE